MASHMGSLPDRGIINQVLPGEGYATLVCGDTEVRIGYTQLSALIFEGGVHTAATRSAINSIICEASLGHTGEQLLTMKRESESEADYSARLQKILAKMHCNDDPEVP